MRSRDLFKPTILLSLLDLKGVSGGVVSYMGLRTSLWSLQHTPPRPQKDRAFNPVR
jgi:hypothetical protein